MSQKASCKVFKQGSEQRQIERPFCKWVEFAEGGSATKGLLHLLSDKALFKRMIAMFEFEVGQFLYFL